MPSDIHAWIVVASRNLCVDSQPPFSLHLSDIMRAVPTLQTTAILQRPLSGQHRWILTVTVGIHQYQLPTSHMCRQCKNPRHTGKVDCMKIHGWEGGEESHTQFPCFPQGNFISCSVKEIRIFIVKLKWAIEAQKNHWRLKKKTNSNTISDHKRQPSKAVKDRRDGSEICCDGLVVPCNLIQGIIVAQGQKGKEIEMMEECIYDRGVWETVLSCCRSPQREQKWQCSNKDHPGKFTLGGTVTKCRAIFRKAQKNSKDKVWRVGQR